LFEILLKDYTITENKMDMDGKLFIVEFLEVLKTSHFSAY